MSDSETDSDYILLQGNLKKCKEMFFSIAFLSMLDKKKLSFIGPG